MIETVAETGSTSSDLAARLRGGDRLPEGHWLIADRQTGGRGRHGREWFDASGNFMGSTLVHGRTGDPPRQTLSLVAGLALHEAVAWHIPGKAVIRLKWPNDLMAGDAKVAGILLEAQGDAVIVGIGVNLVSAPDLPERKTAALSAFGTAPDRDVFAQDLARSFASEVERWRANGMAALVRRWSTLSYPVGTPLSVIEAGGEQIEGDFCRLTPEGSLELRLADGKSHVIHAGEVMLAGTTKTTTSAKEK